MIFEEIDALPEEERRKLAEEALQETLVQPFTKNFLIETPNGYVLGRSPSSKVMLKMAMKSVWERRKSSGKSER